MRADIIVNTDADNQYPARYIPALIQPILDGKADMVIGNRQVDKIDHFSPQKKFLQKLGSWVVRYISRSNVPDAPSGFRAFSREAALRINVLTGYTYTLETIIQASKKNLTIVHIPITTNPKTRESRLIRSPQQYVIRSAVTILRLFLLYEPLRTFFYLGIPFLLVGVGLWVRFLILTVLGETARGSHVQSIIVGSVAILIAFIVFVIGLLGDIVAINRRLQEEVLYFMKQNAFSASSANTEDNLPYNARIKPVQAEKMHE
jgi:glycosyltransferase involved in cell wall biosynthesis